MEEKYSGAVTLGYAILFVSFWLSSLPLTGWFSFESFMAMVPLMVTLGVVLIVTGFFCFLNEAAVESVLFCITGATFTALAFRFVVFPGLVDNTNYSMLDGWMLILYAAVIFYLWIASMGGSSVRQLFLLIWCLAQVAAALANWLSIDVFMSISGYLGLITALLAGWYSAVTIISKKKKAGESAAV